MDMPIELDVDDELDEALEAAPERDLVDLAGPFFFFPLRFFFTKPVTRRLQEFLECTACSVRLNITMRSKENRKTRLPACHSLVRDFKMLFHADYLRRRSIRPLCLTGGGES